VDGVAAMAPPVLIALVGPTAAGKSALALRLALADGGEIVSCDSLQVYRGLDVGSAKPSVEERRRVPHHLVDVVDPDEAFSAAEYARRGRAVLASIRERRVPPIVVGGTGLYLRALLHGLFEGPSRDAALRGRLEAMAARSGAARLHRWLAHVDPDSAARIEPADRVRVVRALEVFHKTGRPLSRHHQAGAEPLRGYDVRLLGLAPSREALREAVETRTQRMMAAGLVEETRALIERYGPELRPLQSIGYRQAAAVVRGTLGVEEARRDIVKQTMRYAKRQMTWFRHQEQVAWCADAAQAEALATRWRTARS
jgi:tRNA dimethylallyltransferase